MEAEECTCDQINEEHNCPFVDEINGECEYCTCCEYCTNVCEADI